jgi:hypothetical protein
MGFNSNFFSQLAAPPLAAQSIHFGEWIFTSPQLMTGNTLLGLGSLESPGLYVVMAYDAGWRPLPYRPLYFGESDKIWSRATPSHENYESWKREAGTATLYRAFHHMTGSTRAQRQVRESGLITHYEPPCNRRLSFDLGLGFLARLTETQSHTLARFPISNTSMATVPSLKRNWEEVFCTWGGAPSATEREKCENAERAIRKAIDACAKLNTRDIEVFAQGSYANRTNVRQDSDVDICVLCKDTFFPDYSMSQGLSNAIFAFSDANYRYPDFKNDVEAALKSYFGAAAVARGNKAFDVHANTYRIDADVVPCFEHRRFMGTPQTNWILSGTQLLPDNSGKIINWPRQNYRNGVDKNDATGRRFKAVVRILKRLRNEMMESGHQVAEPISSYLLECLAWNVPNEGFGHDEYRDDVRYAIAHLWNETRTVEHCREWGEINELKYLFHASQTWTREQVNSFLEAAWNYIGFK